MLSSGISVLIELFLFFGLLSMAYVIEVMVSVTRIVGLRQYDLGAAITPQSALALISRLVVFVYMPLAGFIVDFNSQILNINTLIIPFSIIPVLVVLIAINASYTTKIIGTLIQRVQVTGSYFSSCPEEKEAVRVDINIFQDYSAVAEIHRLGEFKAFSLFVSYVLYYSAWPAIFFAIYLQPEYRTTIFASAALFTGLNTLCSALITDPVTLKLSGQNSTACEQYLKFLVRIRVYSALIAFILTALVSFLLYV